MPYSADLSMPRVGDDPVARRRRRGGRMIDRRERPSSIVRPEPNFSSKKLTCSRCQTLPGDVLGGERLDLHRVAKFS